MARLSKKIILEQTEKELQRYYALRELIYLDPLENRTKSQILFERKAKASIKAELKKAITSGNDDLLFKLIKVRKSIITIPIVGARIKVAELSKDYSFFKKLGKAIAERPKSTHNRGREHEFLNDYLYDLGDTKFDFNNDVKTEKLRKKLEAIFSRGQLSHLADADADADAHLVASNKYDFNRHLVRLGLRKPRTST